MAGLTGFNHLTLKGRPHDSPLPHLSGQPGLTPGGKADPEGLGRKCAFESGYGEAKPRLTPGGKADPEGLGRKCVFESGYGEASHASHPAAKP